MMKILSWNCRGFDNKSKVEALRDLIKSEKPSVILLWETKMEESTSLQIGKKAMQNGDGIC
jgi:exonuclease III